jgi:hypothetical protein
MPSYGDDALHRIGCNTRDFHRSRPALMQTSDRFILLGNPSMVAFTPTENNNYLVEIARNRNPGGNEMLIGDNPNVSSGGGSIPYQSGFVNGGVDDNQSAWNAIIQQAAGGRGVQMDPATSLQAGFNDNSDMARLSTCGSCNAVDFPNLFQSSALPVTADGAPIAQAANASPTTAAPVVADTQACKPGSPAYPACLPSTAKPSIFAGLFSPGTQGAPQ